MSELTRRVRCDSAVTPSPTLPSTPIGAPCYLIFIPNPLDKKQRKTSTGSQACSVEYEYERSFSTESNFSEEALQRSYSSSSSSKGYTSQPSMGSISEDTDYAVSKHGSGMLPSRVVCDSSPSAELDYANKGGSLVGFLGNGDLALAPSSGHQDPSLYKLFRYRCYNVSYNNGECTGEVILLRSQQYCNRFLTGHTGVDPSQWTVDARASLTPQDPKWPSVDSYWRPVAYEEAFQGTKFYDPSLVGRHYFILQHWPWAKDEWSPSDLDLKCGKYFVIRASNDHQWDYLLSSWDSSFTHGLFAFP